MAINVLARTILTNVITDYEHARVVRHIRRRIPVTYVIDRILHVLTTGSQWSRLEVQGGSWRTVYHYFSSWSEEGLFEQAYKRLLTFYLKVRPLSDRVIVDTSFIKNVFGRDCVGPSPFDRGRKATKVSALVDQSGIPIVFTFHRGNRNDSRTLGHTLSKSPVSVKGLALYADKIYDSEHCRDVIRRFGLVNSISRKKHNTTPGDNRKRIVVEHTFSWLDKFRRIILRYDAKVSHLRSFHYLAAFQLVVGRFFRDL